MIRKDDSIKKKKKRLGEEGFTLMELLLVVALIAMMIVATLLIYPNARLSTVTNVTDSDLNNIVSSISEYRTYKGSIPADTSWPGALTNYVDANLQTKYGYNCASGVLTITTGPADNNTQATRLLSKLTDQGICDTGSAINAGTNTEIDCIIPSFNGSAGC